METTIDIEMTDSSDQQPTQTKPINYLLTGSLLPQRKYLSNRTGRFLTDKQEASNRLKRKDLTDEEELNCMKKLKVDQ